MPATTFFTYNEATAQAPGVKQFEITPDDVNELSDVVRQIYVGNGGTVVVVDTLGNEVSYKNVPSGSYLGPFFVKQVKVAPSAAAADLIGIV